MPKSREHEFDLHQRGPAEIAAFGCVILYVFAAVRLEREVFATKETTHVARTAVPNTNTATKTTIASLSAAGRRT